MDIREDIQPVSALSTRTEALMALINQARRPVYLTQNGQACGVLVDPETFEETKQALALLKLMAQSEKDFEEGRHTSQEEVFGNLETKLRSMQQKEAS